MTFKNRDSAKDSTYVYIVVLPMKKIIVTILLVALSTTT